MTYAQEEALDKDGLKISVQSVWKWLLKADMTETT